MFRIPRKLFITVAILAALLATVPPASAGTRGGSRFAWEGLLSRVLGWLGDPAAPGFGAAWSQDSAGIDPLGQPGNSGGKSDSSAGIDPDGQPKAAIVPGDSGNSDTSADIDPNGKPR